MWLLLPKLWAEYWLNLGLPRMPAPKDDDE
jgi:hypothetical protein